MNEVKGNWLVTVIPDRPTMKRRLITITALAVFCASPATGQLAQGTNAVTITHEEYEALVQYHIDRLDTTNAIALTAGEWEVLNKCRADEATEKEAEAKRRAELSAMTFWERAKRDKWQWISIGACVVYAVIAWLVNLCFYLKRKWDDWRTDVWYRKNHP